VTGLKNRFVLVVAFATVCWTATPYAEGSGFSWEEYAAVLDGFVDNNGLVDYASLKNGRSNLDLFVSSLAGLDRGLYESWDNSGKIAFWINAYNGLTLKLIIDNYPIKSSRLKSVVFPTNSIRQISGAWEEIFFEVMGEAVTLDSIEHKILRSGFDEPRIHMALVCAAISCPVLRNEPYSADRLEQQLEDQALRFIANPLKFQVDRESGVVRLSAIFDWFAGDFIAVYGTGDPPGKRSEKTQAVLNFVSRYVSEEDRVYIETGDYEVKHLDYDWTLNEQPPL
jgi:hypothetical protein